ncbi:hypothetical protein ACOSHH_005364, partial [Klebsiella aerogenes]
DFRHQTLAVRPETALRVRRSPAGAQQLPWRSVARRLASFAGQEPKGSSVVMPFLSFQAFDGGQDIIVATFGQKGRQHRSRDNTPAILDEIASRYRLAAYSCQASTQSDIACVKKHYQTGIRAARNREK